LIIFPESDSDTRRLRLLLDEDSQAKTLRNHLRAAGHDVLTVSEADLVAHEDAEVLAFARQEKRILLTRNCDDFLTLHRANPDHSGIFAVYEDRDLSKNMSYASMVQAIANLISVMSESDSDLITEQFVVLNTWNY
jgi:uncharacterized protein with PIN domain